MTHLNDKTSDNEARLETHVQALVGSQVRHLRVVCRNNGVILHGSARTYCAKQLTQHLVTQITNLTILANEIEVC